MVLLWRLGALGIGFALCVSAQQAPPAPATPGQSAPSHPPVGLIPRSREEREARDQANHRVILNVLVTNPSGEPVAGLKEDDFTLLDNQQPEKIATFRSVQGGTEVTREHVLLVLDAVNNSPRNIGFERKGLEKFLTQSPGQLPIPVSIVLLSAAGTSASQPSKDPGYLSEQLKGFSRVSRLSDCDNDQMATRQTILAATGMASLPSAVEEANGNRAADCLNQRFRLSVSTLNKLAREQVEIPGRALVVWLGAGWPFLNGPEFRPDTPELGRNYFSYLANLSTSLREAQVTLDAVSSPDQVRDVGLDWRENRNTLDRSPTGDEASASNFALPVLAYQTGGQVLVDSKDLATEIAACLKDVELYYVLAFDSTPTVAGPEYHSLQVKLNKPGLTVRTSTGYYTEP